MPVIIELQYLPTLPYFSKIIRDDRLIIENEENFQKQTYRNRCYVLAANGVMALTVPVVKSHNKLIREIKIDYSQNWQQIHLRTLSSAYGKSSYFEYYFQDFEKIILSKKQFLFDLNLELLTKCLSILKVNKEIEFTNNYNHSYDLPFNDCRNEFSIEKVKPEIDQENAQKYFQLFGNVFVNHLSIVDLIFNEGTNAKQYLYKI